MAKTSKAATLAALLATDAAPVPVKTPATINVKLPSDALGTAPATLPVTVSKKNAVKTALTVATTVPVADGYSIAISDDIDAAQIKAAIVRNTANPWYAVALLLASRTCATFKIVRNDNVKGTPLARINAAITRGRKIQVDAQMRGIKVPTEVQYFHKLGVSQHATEKNTWLFVKMA